MTTTAIAHPPVVSDGWPLTPTKDGDWVRHHDKYGDVVRGSDSCCGSTAGEART